MILVINSGSSSIKFQLFKTSRDQLIKKASGIAERIGVDGHLKIETFGEKNQEYSWNIALPNHLVAVEALIENFKSIGIIKNIDDIKGVGFRVVHGGKDIKKPVIITPKIKAIIKENVKLAPLHNPGALIAIEAFEKLMPKTPLIAQFDTAFHQTIPKLNYLYPVPYDWYTEYDVRKYGFHGISAEYITEKMSEILNKPQSKLNLLICHLGNGASLTVVKNGRSLDTTMGLTPLAGLMMGTRSGDIDPSILEYMASQLKMDVHQVTDILNKESGLLGMSKVSSDIRDVQKAKDSGNELAKLAWDKYAQTVADFIVDFANELHGNIDALAFTAGIGENSAPMRQSIVGRLWLLHVHLDHKANDKSYSDWKLISNKQSAIPIYAVRTNEELMIAEEVKTLIK